MAAGKKKPVRWTIPDVRGAPPRPLAAERSRVSRPPEDAWGYPSAAELISRGPETRAWLEAALRAIVQPVAVASALSIGATGCIDIGELLSEDPSAAPVFAGAPTHADEPATLSPLGPPTAGNGGGVVMHPLPPDKPEPVTSVAPCPLPPLGGTAVAGEAPAVTSTPVARPPAHPPAMRGRMRPIRPPAPPPAPIVPAVDPIALDGDIAMVHPEPPVMPGGPALVMPPDGGAD